MQYVPAVSRQHSQSKFFPFQNWLSLPRVIQEIMFGLSSSPVSGRLHRFHTHLMLRTGDKYCIFIQSTLIQSISWQFLLHPCTCAAIAPLHSSPQLQPIISLIIFIHHGDKVRDFGLIKPRETSKTLHWMRKTRMCCLKKTVSALLTFIINKQ